MEISEVLVPAKKLDRDISGGGGRGVQPAPKNAG